MADENGIVIDPSSVNTMIGNINDYTKRVQAGLLVITKQVAVKMENWAKNNAPWTDRTTNARRGLFADADWENVTNLVVSMSHTVDYGPMLELAYERKYAILERAIEEHKDEFITQWEKIIKGTKVK